MRYAIWFLVVLALPIHAAVYRWEDATGKTHYGQRAPADAANVKKITIRKATDPAKKQVRATAPEAQKKAGARPASSGKRVAMVEEDAVARKAERCARATAREKAVSASDSLTRRSRRGTRMILSHRQEQRARLQARQAVSRWCR